MLKYEKTNINELSIKWKRTDYILPDEDIVVETKISDEYGERNHAKLKRIGNLWFVADCSMYVYYKPTHWRY